MTENSFGKSLGELINRKRKSQGLTQLQLAEDAYGNSNKVRRISELENGTVANPYPKTIDPIIITLGISEEELEECAVLSDSKPDANLDRAYREAKHLIEEIAKQFEHSHPETSLNELDEFLRSKASEWLELKERISELDAIDGTVVELHTSANDALADGDFDKVDALLLQAEDLQQGKRTLNEVRKQSKIRRTRGDVCFLRGEVHDALDHYLSSAAFLKPFDEQEMVALLEELAGTLYEAGRMSIEPHFFVAAELIEAALAVNYVSESPHLKADFSFKLGLIYRNAGMASSSAEKALYIDKAITHTRAALSGLIQPEDHFTLISAKIGLGNCLLDKARLEKDLDTIESAIHLFQDVKEEIEQSGKSTELLGHAYNNLAGALIEVHQIAQTEVTEQTLDEVLIAYQAAITASETSNDIENWGAAKANYGYRLAQKAGLKTIKMEEAIFLRIQSISAFLAALETYPSTLFPRQYAQTHIGLADVLVQQGQNANENLMELHFFRALGSYNGACEIYFTEDRHPIPWAEIQRKIGQIFAIHAQLEDTESTHSDLERAIEHFENAQRVFKQHNISAEIEACSNALETLSKMVKQIGDAE